MAPAAADVNATEVLVEALPYIRQFSGTHRRREVRRQRHGRPGARRAASPPTSCCMHSVGIQPVVVHGGGPQIGDLMSGSARSPSSATACASPTPRPSTSPAWCSSARSTATSSPPSTPTARSPSGLSGEDAGLIEAEPAHPELGFVGDVDERRTRRSSQRLLAEDLIPVVVHHRRRRRRPGLQHQRRHRGRRHRRRARGREGRLPHRRRRAARATSPTRPASSPPPTPPRSPSSSTTGVLSGGMIPKIEAVPRRARGRRAVGPPPRRPRAPRRCCSSCSPAPASAP